MSSPINNNFDKGKKVPFLDPLETTPDKPSISKLAENGGSDPSFGAGEESMVDYTGWAKSGEGDFEITKYLYETGLKNVFDDYIKNVGTLDKNKQLALQDSYRIAEMSKKYLGEYASNNNIGDVSGNLLGIYSDYMKNQTEINKHFGELSLGLENDYLTKKRDIMTNLISNAYQQQVAKFDAMGNDVLANIQSGQTNGMSSIEYLNSMKDKLTDSDYKTLKKIAYQAEKENALAALDPETGGYYGMTVDEDGTPRPKTREEYIDRLKYILNPHDYADLMEGIKYEKYMDEEVSKAIPQIVQEDIDPSYTYGGDKNVTADSKVFKNELGQEMYQVMDPITRYLDSDTGVAFQDIKDSIESNGGSIQNGNVYTFEGIMYYYENGSFYELTQAEVGATNMNEQLTDSVQRTLTHENPDIMYNRNDKEMDTFTFGGVNYVQDGENQFKIGKKEESEDIFQYGTTYKELVDIFRRYHPEDMSIDNGIVEPSIVWHNGRFWIADGGKIWAVNKQTGEQEG